MEMYVLQVKSGYEESAARILNHKGYKSFCPTEEMHIRYGGQWHKKLKLVFTQYIFIECKLSDEDYYRIKTVCGVIRFLGHGKPEPLFEHERAYIHWLHNNGKPIEASKVYVTSTGEKMILSGILRSGLTLTPQWSHVQQLVRQAILQEKISLLKTAMTS